MSQYTLWSLPKDIRHIMRIYHQASLDITSAYRNDYIRKYLQKSDPQYNIFRRYKLLHERPDSQLKHLKYRSDGKTAPWFQFNPNDFEPILSKVISPIFESTNSKKSIWGDLENFNVDDLFNSNVHSQEQPALISDSNVSSKPLPAFESNIMSILRCYYQPYQEIPKVNRLLKSFHWYRNTLQNTPIIIFLKQKNRLFAQSSLSHINKPLVDLNNYMNDLSLQFFNQENFESGDDKLKRNYHLTDLTLVDIFNMALKTESLTSLDSLNWSRINQVEDKLASVLLKHQQVNVIDSNSTVVDKKGSVSRKFIQENPLSRISNSLLQDPTQIKYIFPYDLQYSSYQMITIEQPVIQEDHSFLLDHLQKQSDDFEIIAVRLSLNNDLISNFFTNDLSSSSKTPSGNYQDMLQAAKRSHLSLEPNDPHAHIASCIKKLGEMGLATVDEGSTKNCIYLFSSNQ